MPQKVAEGEKAMKTQQCSDCQHWEIIDCNCLKGHKPRLYYPRNPLDRNWGYKRRCRDFASKPCLEKQNEFNLLKAP